MNQRHNIYKHYRQSGFQGTKQNEPGYDDVSQHKRIRWKWGKPFDDKPYYRVYKNTIESADHPFIK
jgi:hypothetical protein